MSQSVTSPQNDWKSRVAAILQGGQSSAPTEPQQQAVIDVEVEDGGFLERNLPGMLDSAKGILSAPTSFADKVSKRSWSVGNFAKETGQWLWGKLPGTTPAPPPTFRSPTKEEQKNLALFEHSGPVFKNGMTYDPTTPIGQLSQSVAELVFGFNRLGSAMKVGKVLGGASKTAKGAVIGAEYDALTLEPLQKRISNLLNEFPQLHNPITQFLAADPNNSEADNLLRGTLEGLALGALADSLLYLAKAYRGLRGARSQIDAIKTLTELNEEMAQRQMGQLDIEAADPKAKAAGEARRAQAAAQNAQDALFQRNKKQTTGAGFTGSTRPTINQTPEDFMARVQAAKTTDEALELVSNDVNLRRMVWDDPAGARLYVSSAEAISDKMTKNADLKTLKQIMAESAADLNRYGIDATPLLETADAMPGALTKITNHLTKSRLILHQVTTEALRLAEAVSGGAPTAIEKMRYGLLSQLQPKLLLAVKDAGTNMARGLASLRQTVDNTTSRAAVGEGEDFLTRLFPSTKGLSEQQAEEWLAKANWSDDVLRNHAVIVRTMGDDLPAAARYLAKQPSPRIRDMWMEIRMMDLLSSPFTWGANFLSGLMKTFEAPAVRAIGGLMAGDREAIQSSGRVLMGIGMHVYDSARMAYKVLKSGKNILDAGNTAFEAPLRVNTYDNVKRIILEANPNQTSLMPHQELIAWFHHGLGKVCGGVSRAMLVPDEFIKQLNFRAEMSAKLWDEALNNGATNFSELRSHIVKRINEGALDPVTEAANNSPLAQEALRAAQERTFTQPLENGSWGKTLQNAANRHFFAKLAVPFIKSPVNIVDDFWMHTPTAPLGKRFKAEIAKGGEAKADALGKVALGSMTTYLALQLAADGLITGDMPKDSKLREQRLATGWQPYSLYINGKYWSYRRFDPPGMFLGLTASAYDLLSGKDDLTDADFQEVAVGLMACAVNNLLSKLYYQGILETVNVLADAERYGMTYSGRMAATFVPASSLLREVRKLVDPHMREMESVDDYIQNVIPVMSRNLPVRRNWVTGAPEDYFTFRSVDKKDAVLNEMVRLGKQIQGAPTRYLNGVELTGQQYSELCRLHGEVKLDGKTMYEALENLFKLPMYDAARKHYGDAPSEYHESPRGIMVDRVIEKYRKAATLLLQRQYPQLAATIREKSLGANAAKAGFLRKDNEPAALQKIQNLVRY